MKKILATLAILLFTQISSSAADSCDSKVFNAFIPKTKEASILLCKHEIAIGYSTEKKTPLWVAYYMTPEKTAALPAVKERPYFRTDPNISEEKQANLGDYLNSGYDRGHLAPFEDMNHTIISAKESMMLSNIIPQNVINNRGIWKALEERIRKDSLNGAKYIIVGPIFNSNPITIGNNIPVPSKLFKVVIDEKTKNTQIYIIPNTGDSIHISELHKYLVSMNELLHQTKFTAFIMN